MAITDSHGTQTATVTTEHTLFDSSAAGTYQLVVDPVNMVAGDALELRIYYMVLTGGTRRVIYKDTWTGAQHADAMQITFPPLGTALTDSGAWRATLKQTLGTSRNFPWVVLIY